MTDSGNERELADQLKRIGCETGLSRNGRLLRVDNRACPDPLPPPLLESILNCSKLRDLYLRQIGDWLNGRMDQMVALTRLRTLDVAGSGLSDTQLDQLQHCPSLEVLNVRDTQVTPQRVAELRKRMIGTRIIL